MNKTPTLRELREEFERIAQQLKDDAAKRGESLDNKNEKEKWDLILARFKELHPDTVVESEKISFPNWDSKKEDGGEIWRSSKK